ncbi:MAG: type II toxin-antitoxin system RatA family toxin [Gammaproteobacteria bacterium]
MVSVTKSTVVPFSAEQMYDLVNDIEAYPSFLSWCEAARVLNRGQDRLTASLSLSVGRIKQSFTTENSMQPGRRIDLQLLSGPFKYLNGHWQFDPHSDHSCCISVQMDFEFRNKLLKLALDKVFSHIIMTLIDSFTHRAQQLYGRQ